MPEPVQVFPHLLVIDRVETQDFHRTGGGGSKIRIVQRKAHGDRLLNEASQAITDGEQDRLSIDDERLRAAGSVILIEGATAIELLKLKSLDRADGSWILLTVSQGENGIESAAVWVSDKHREKFLRLFKDYLDDSKNSKNRLPKNNELVANMARIRKALLDDLWQSDGQPGPGNQWWELWLTPSEGAETSVRSVASKRGWEISTKRIQLVDRLVLWVRTTWADLRVLIATSAPIAEVRRAQFIDSLVELPSEDQQVLIDDLVSRISIADSNSPAVCVLDTGTRRSHDLLSASLAVADWHSLTSSAADAHGHGTKMAGLALFGSVETPLLSAEPIVLRHRLESVKLYPEKGQEHEPSTYGLVTAQAVSIPESTANRRRVFCLPISAPQERSDRPSLWSASLDALAMGTDIGQDEHGITLIGVPDPGATRLFIVAAGNCEVQLPPTSYLDVCDTSLVEDPSQAWNCLVVGATTCLDTLPTDPSFHDWTLLAIGGELSPHSRTGLMIGTKWPVRPDVCMEGGNVLTNGTDLESLHPSVALLTTGRNDDAALTTANATSAATALASRLAARVLAQYPSYWPETVRGLIVHGAEWTPAMKAAINAASKVQEKRNVLGRYGWGVPNEDNVLASATNAVTMVVQDEFVPFSGPEYAMRQFRLHTLPWPQEDLQALGAEDIQLRVTLSYFVEPSAARRGWRDRYSYASHLLRFELRNPVENTSEFVRRVGRSASNEESGKSSTDSGNDRWTMGPVTRNQGSLHQDTWDGSAADLAQCGMIAVHPIGGWWKNSKRKDRRDLPVRYSLIISLRSRREDIDIYTPVATQLHVPIQPIAIEV